MALPLRSPPPGSSRSSSSSYFDTSKAAHLPLLYSSITSTATSHANRRRTRAVFGLVVASLCIGLVLRASGYPTPTHWLNKGVHQHDTSGQIDDAAAPALTSDDTQSKLPPPPLTELGYEADYVYENIGSTDMNEYRTELEDFLHNAFPTSDSDAADPDSLLSVLHDFLPPPPPSPPAANPQTAFQRLILSPFATLHLYIIQSFRAPPDPPALLSPKPRRAIPRHIYQSSPYGGPSPDPAKSMVWSSWNSRNPDYDYRYYDDPAADAFIDERFNGTGKRGIKDTYWSMKDVPVMQSDFWRYAVLAAEGGVYSDMDTKCLKAIKGWHRPLWERDPAVFEDPNLYPIPAMIIGIEADVGRRLDWHKYWPRPLGFVQWTLASAKGHPIMLDVLRRVTEVVNPANITLLEERKGAVTEHGHRKLDAIVEMTGPGAYTDAVLRYLLAKYNTAWPAFRNLDSNGIMFGDNDVLVLSATAFSPGVGLHGAGDVNHAAALVQHLFAGTWKSQWG